MSPFIDVPYAPTLIAILAGLDTDYKNESFKLELLKLNPNNINDREKIIKNYLLESKSFLSYRHKFVLLEEIEKALASNAYDFNALFEYDYEAEEASPSPWAADEIKTPRSFFEDVFRVAKKVWETDLNKAAMEDPSTW